MKREFDFEGRPSTDDPEMGKNAFKSLVGRFKGHSPREKLEMFARADRKLGLLDRAAIEVHLKDGCKECLAIVEVAKK